MTESTGGPRSATALRTSSTLRMLGVGLLAALAALLLTVASSAETPGVTIRESVRTATTDGQGDGESANASISADGQWVAFDSDATNLTTDAYDGFRRVFLRNRETRRTSVVSTAPGGGPLTGDARNPSVSADGRKVAFEAEVERPPVVIEARNELERIVYTSNETGSVEIYTAWADGSDPQQLTDTPEAESDPAFSPDRSRIAFSRDGEIWVMDAGGGETPARLTESPDRTFSDQPAWAPDGRRLVFRRGLTDQGDSSEGGGIFVVDVDTGETTQLTDSTFRIEGDAWPDWSPDGRWIAFSNRNRSGDSFEPTEPGIYVVEVVHDDGQVSAGDLSRVTTGDDRQPRWHPVRASLVFSRTDSPGQPAAIWMVDVVPAVVVLGAGDVTAAAVQGDASVPLTDDAGSDSRPAWAGDGFAVTFTSDRAEDTALDLYRVTLSGNPDGGGGMIAGDPERVTAGNPLGASGRTDSPHHASTNRGLATPFGASVTVRGQEGQPTPQGRVRFEVRTRQLGGLTPLSDNGDGTASATSLRTSAMTPPYDFGAPNTHCLAVTYSGDSVYRSTRHTEFDLCARVTRHQPTIAADVNSEGDSTSVSVRVSGADGQPLPRGMVSFFLCGPRPSGAGCVEGGDQVGWVQPLDGGQASSQSVTVDEPGQYCWRVEYAGDFVYHPADYANNSSFTCPVLGGQRDGHVFGAIESAGTSGSADGFPPATPVVLQIMMFTDQVFGEPPQGRGLVWLCGPDEVGPAGCVEGGTLLESQVIDGPSVSFSAAAPGDLTRAYGTYCFRVDYRWPEGADPADQTWAEESYTATDNARDTNTAMCFDIVDDGFDLATSRTSVFVHDRGTRRTTLVSTGLDGEPADGDSYQPSISGDGSRVAFTSEASNLTTEDLLTEGENVFVRDLGAAPPATTLVSVPQAECPIFASMAADLTASDGSCFGESNQPSISADGGFVAFTTDAYHLDVANPPDADFLIGEFRQVVVRDLAAGTTTVESLGPDAQPGFGDSFAPSISADGSRVAFTSRADDLVEGDANDVDDVFLRDRTDEQTSRVSVGSGGQETDEASGESAVSADGRSVAFSSGATTLVATHEPCAARSLEACPRDVYVHDTVRATTAQLSVDSNGSPPAPGSDSRRPSVSADARHVAFDSDADDLVPDDDNGERDVFVRDRIPVLVLDPDPLEFPARAVGSSDVRAVTARNAGSGPLAITGAAVTDGDTGDFEVDASACVDAALHRADSCVLQVTFSPTAAGTRAAVLSVESTDPRGPQRVRLIARDGARPVGRLTVDPDPVDFGVVPVGEEAESQTVTVRSVGTRPVRIGAVGLGGQDAQRFDLGADADGCSGRILSPGEECEIVLGYAPDVTGRHVATLTLPSNARGAPQSLALRGQAPRLEVNPPLGRPGIVTEVNGSDFPANTPLRLQWDPGLGSQLVVTDDTGAFRGWMLVMRRDHRGPRVLEARGDGFTVPVDFLVVPPSQQPGDFVKRR